MLRGETRVATERDVEERIAAFWIPENRSCSYDFGVTLPTSGCLRVDLNLGRGEVLAAGTLVEVIQAEIVDQRDVLIGFVLGAMQGVCALEEIEISPR